MSSLRAALAAAALAFVIPLTGASHEEASVEAFRARLGPAERAFLEQHPVVRYGADPGWPPFEVLDADGGHAGLSHDLLTEISTITGQRYEPIGKDSWAAKLEAARSGEVDMLASVLETPDRQAFLRFTAPYLELFQVIITRNDHPYINSLAELDGKTLAVVRGVASAEWLTRHQPGIVQVPVADIRAALTAVAVGRAAATVLPLASANYQIQLHGLSNLQITAPVDALTGWLKFGVRKDWPEQAAILEQAMRAIPPSRMAEIRGRWLIAPQIKVVDGLSSLERRVAIGAGVLLVLASLWIFWLRAEINKRRSAQSRAEQAEQRLRELAAGIPGALWQFRRDRKGRQYYSYMSEGIRRITGRSPEETNAVMQAKSFETVHPEDQERLAALMQRLTENGSLGEEIYRLKTQDGRWIWVRSAAVARRESDGTLVWNGITLDATQAVEIKSELAAARQRMKELIDSVPGAVWQLRLSQGRYLVEYVSEGVSAVSGRPAAEHLGDAESTLSTVVLADREHLLANLERSARDGGMVEQQVRMTATDGRLRHLLVRANVSHNAEGEPVWTGVLQDMTEQRQLEAALADARARLDDIIANFPGTIWQLKRDRAGREFFTYVSEGISQITGFPAAQVIGQPSSMFYPLLAEEDQQRSQQALELAVEGTQPVAFDYCLNLPGDERTRWVRVTATGRREADGELVWNGVVLDATEQKMLEQDLRRARVDAEAANQAKSRFLANMSHEIRTPMNAVIGLSHLALGAEKDPEKKERLEKINRAAKSLLRLLNDILEFSKLEAQKLRLMPMPFSLREMVEGLRLLADAPAAEKGLRFSIQQEPGLPRQLVGDPLRIQQVLLNLISNATKFTDAGEVLLRIRQEQPADSGALVVAFEVSDTGIGMSDAHLARVFDAFEQADDSASRRHGGTGLGLTITQELVRLMGGEIVVRSQLGVGTVFTVRLPMNLPSAPEPPRPSVQTAAMQESLAQCVFALLELLRQHDTAARGKAIQLHGLLLAEQRERDLELLERQLSAYDFDSAERELRRLAARWGLTGH